MDIEVFWNALMGPTGNMTQFVDRILGTMGSFAGVLVTIYVAYKVILYMANISSNLDPFVLVKPVSILAALGLYQELVALLIIKPIMLLQEILEDAAKAQFGSNFDADFMTSITNTYQGTPSVPGVFQFIGTFPVLETIHLIIYFAAMVVAYYMLMRQVIFASIYYVLGTLALPLSLIVGNQGVLGGWFFSFISIMLWGPVLIILKCIIVSINPVNNNYNWTNAIVSIALQIVMVLTILRIPSFANSLVSSGSALSSNVGDTVISTITNTLKSAGNSMKKSEK